MISTHSFPLTSPRAAHLVGIAGAGMRSLAQILRDHHWQVSGSDESLEPHVGESLRALGVKAVRGHAAANVPPECDVLVYSPAVPGHNVEREAAARRDIPQLALQEFLGLLMAGHEGISIIGTHGKSTTTALVGHLLECAGLSPVVFCGAERRAALQCRANQTAEDSGAAPPSSEPAERSRPFVLESCEYRRHFLHLAPQQTLLLNIEPDHFDCFPTLADALDAYREFVSRLPEDGTLVVNGDCPASMQVSQSSRARVVTFGESPAADWRLPEQLADDAIDWPLSLSGRHNRLNALGVVALCHQLGVPIQLLRDSLSSFAGIGRRFEVIGAWAGRTVIDDYAHHPTAIAATLRSVRERFPGRRVVAVFQPHQMSRTLALQQEFADALGEADEVLLAPIYRARESDPGEQARADRVLQELSVDINRRGTFCRCCSQLDQIIPTVETDPSAAEVLLIMGAGDIERVGYEISGRLQ